MNATQRQSWEERGFFIERGFYSASVVEEMIERVVEIVRMIDTGAQRPDLWLTPERRLADQPKPEDRLAKLFRVMRTEEVFRSSATDPRLLSILAESRRTPLRVLQRGPAAQLSNRGRLHHRCSESGCRRLRQTLCGQRLGVRAPYDQRGSRRAKPSRDLSASF